MTDVEMDTEALEQETRRLCQRYIDEVVLPFELCPWAAPALKNGAVQMSVITTSFSGSSSHDSAADDVLAALRGCTDESIELVLVLLPRCDYSRLEMDDLLRTIRARQQGRRGGSAHDEDIKSEISFALAAFHPEAAPNTSAPERFIPYLRRTPDPMIQAVRTATLKRIDPRRGAGTAYVDLENMNLEQLTAPPAESLRTRIARVNLETCKAAGLEALEARFASILADHAATRQRLSGRIS